MENPPNSNHTNSAPPAPRKRGQGCTTKILRAAFVVINLAFFCFGLALIIIATVYYKSTREVIEDWADDVTTITNLFGHKYDLKEHLEDYDYAAVVHGTVIGIGVAICLLSFLGIIAFCCGSVCLICLYTVILLIFACLELGIGIAGLVIRNDIPSYIEPKDSPWGNDLASDLKFYGLDRWPQIVNGSKCEPCTMLTDFIDEVQEKYGCCGIHSYKDWKSLGDLEKDLAAINYTRNYPRDGDVPNSCCHNQNTRLVNNKIQECGYQLSNKDEDIAGEFINTQGCVELLIETLQDSITLYCGIKICISLLMIFGVLYACAVAWDIKRANKE